MIKVLFVCHGNICRSPMAEFILKDMVHTRGIGEFFLIDSAATSSEEIWNGRGNPVYPPARRELERHGIFCGKKKARQVTPEDYEKYDLILCAEQTNIRNLRRIIPCDPEGKIHLMLAWSDHPRNIADPWYSCDFEEAYRDIVEACETILAHLGF